LPDIDDIEKENGDKVVPVSVLDRFLRISKENNISYAAMVSAVDAISAKVMEMGDQVSELTGAIEDEQLAQVMNTAVASITHDVDRLQIMMGVLKEPKYNILKALAECLEFKRATEIEVQATAKSVIWFLEMVTMFRNNRGKLIFLGAIALSVLLGSNSITLWDAVKIILK